MKKVLAAIIVLAVLVGITACGNSCFKSQEDMFAYLNGMWVVDDLDRNEYYIFQDGQVHQMEDWSFKHEMETYLDDTLKNTGLEALCRLDYKTVLATLRTEDILGNPYSGIEINYQKGTIVLNKDESNEKHIIVNESSVGIKYAKEEDTTLLKKISDEVDFTGAHFEDLFNDAKNNYTVSTTQFWTNTKEYGAMVKAFNSEVDGWELTTQNDTTTIYESNKWVPDISGSLIITDTLVSFSKEVSLYNKWTYGIDFNPSFKVLYTPGNSVIIQDIDNMSLNMVLLIQYAANAFRQFPGALDHIEVYNLIAKEFENGNYTIEDGWAKVEIKVNGISYRVMQGTSGTKGYVFASADETINLSDIIDSTQTAPEETQPEQTETTEPAVTEPVQTIPMNDVPYTTSLGAAVSIFDGPSYDYTYVQSVGQDGIYTIVEEAYDSEGNLWGKLKSGLGWVLLEEAYTASGRTCPQCGLSEPDAIFTEDWQPGDICFGCSYDNFHGGEEAKKYCSQCGADCTYRGLEEDGRCEDCYFGN